MAPKENIPRVEIANPQATVQTSSGNEPSKVVCVKWETVSAKPVEGEWIVEWDDMYSDLSDDLRSARSEKGDYFVLQREGGRTDATTPGALDGAPASVDNGYKEVEVRIQQSTPVLKQTEEHQQRPNIEDDLPTAPLSTARLLAFENGLKPEEDDLQGFFSLRPIVQAPTHITPDSNKRAKAYFLLAPGTAVPTNIKIYFIPTWNPLGSEPHALAEVAVSPYQVGEEDLHTKWAQVRMEDLKILEEIAKELEREGSRGVGTGTVKVGVEGGGMDEEAVRREGWMVGEEMHWVRDKFLGTCSSLSERSKNENQGLGLGLGIFGGAEASSVSVVTSDKETHPRPHLAASIRTSAPAASEDEDEDDLFALPLSPRSPDMAISPFSMFRGDPIVSDSSRLPAPFSSSIPAKLREITSIDTSSSAMKSLGELRSPNVEVTPTNSDAHVTPTMTVGMQRLGLGSGNPPPTPPQEHRGEDGLFAVGVRQRE